MSVDFEKIIGHFTFEGVFIKAEPYGSGHINDTYAVYFRKMEGQVHRYIMQRINHKIFKAPEKVMENIVGVIGHLRGKIIKEGGDPQREAMVVIETVEGNSFFKSEEGEFWRSYKFIEQAKTYDVVENPEHFYNGGLAFGKFQRLLSDYPAKELHETIPDFHNTKKRYETFQEAVKQDSLLRADRVAAEIRFIEERAKDTSVLVDLLEKGKLPLRVTHNDTKFNNVMIDDETGKGICVIDLDTVMPGLSLYDFGDSIRTGANTGEEDEKDLSKITLSLKLFEQFTKGFLEATGGSLTSLELEYLPFSAKMMTLENSIRFLTDYLKGDIYYKVHREGHNLDRARTQIKLVLDIEEKMEQMKKIIAKYS